MTKKPALALLESTFRCGLKAHCAPQSHMCSQEELVYVREGFQLDVRSDGRNTEQLRSIVLETGQLVQASGSARLKLGATDVLVAVKVSAGATPS